MTPVTVTTPRASAPAATKSARCLPGRCLPGATAGSAMPPPGMPASARCRTSFGKRANGVTISTHRLGKSLWITSGRTGEKMWSRRMPRPAVPSEGLNATSARTPPVDAGKADDLQKGWSSPVSTAPMTTTILYLYPAITRKRVRDHASQGPSCPRPPPCPALRPAPRPAPPVSPR